ncbi:MAG: ketoacyl-ACP synthase III [Tannerella sp.]|jgi:3-oxoacyl-[acyl-carrier-protein] synthase-3|nr:ketoacyl-ACP synthase III [Tannerella sp.]
MNKLNAVITGLAAYVPDDVLTNEDISRMVDTSDEWITTRVGIKERHILKDNSLGTSYLGIKAVNELFRKTGVDPLTIDGIICATSTGDYVFPNTASIIAYQTGCTHAFAFDMQVACTGFVYGLETAANFIRTGQYKRIILVAGDKMTAITDYTDRTTCPLFGDACGAVLLEPTTEPIGLIDTILRTDGSGLPFLHLKAGGTARRPSHETIDNREHYVYQEGKAVFKRAVTDMASVALEIVERNGLKKEDIDWVVPHQANLRIVEAVIKNLDGDINKVMINIQKYGNTSAGTIPVCLWEWEKRLKKGDKLLLAAFGAGYTWGANLLVWGYDGAKA